MNCRSCKKKLKNTFLDLGSAPPSNSYLTKKHLSSPEKFYPLKTMICDNCWLLQTVDYLNSNIFFNESYAYLSSTSDSWLKHTADYTEKIISLLNLSEKSFVTEIASNDGYLLKNFVKRKIPCIGIEPTSSTAKLAKKGVPVIEQFFTRSLGKSLAKKERNRI